MSEQCFVTKTSKKMGSGKLFCNFLMIAIFAITSSSCSQIALLKQQKVDMSKIIYPQNWIEKKPEMKEELKPDINWWKYFNDPLLANLIDEAIKNSVTTQKAALQLEKAREAKRGVLAVFLPSTSAGVSPQLGQIGTNDDLYTSGFDAAWELDIFGKNMKEYQAADANVATQKAAEQSIYISLSAEVARNYFDIINLHNQIKIAEDSLASKQKLYEIVASQNKAGIASELDLSRAKSELNSAKAGIPLLESSLKQNIYSLELLLNQQPGSLKAKMEKAAKLPSPPMKILISSPIAVINNRPDIKQAESNLLKATKIKESALKDFYPKISLSTFLGFQSGTSSDAFSADARTANLGSSISFPLLDFGKIGANVNQKIADEKVAFIDFQQAIYNAVAEVEKLTIAYNSEEQRRKSLEKAVKSAEISVQIASSRYNEGLSSFIDVIDAQRSLYKAQSDLAESKAKILIYATSLYKALGGMWIQVDNSANSKS